MMQFFGIDADQRRGDFQRRCRLARQLTAAADVVGIVFEFQIAQMKNGGHRRVERQSFALRHAQIAQRLVRFQEILSVVQ